MQIHIIHIALILVLILILTLILILFIILIIRIIILIIRIIPSSYASSPHHPHHPLIILIVLIIRIVLVVLILLIILTIIMGFWSRLYETNHPFQFALGSRAHGCCVASESSGSWGFRPGRRGPCIWWASTFYISFSSNEYLNGFFLFSRKII